MRPEQTSHPGVSLPGLVVAAPEFRYFDDQVAGPPTPWGQANGDWRCTDGTLECRLSVRPGESGSSPWRLDIQVHVLRPIRIERCAVSLLAAPASSPAFWSRHSRWISLPSVHTVPELTALAVRWLGNDRQQMELRSARHGPAAALAFHDPQLTVTLILDDAGLHPRWFFGDRVPLARSSPLRTSGTTFTATLFLWTPGENDPLVTLSSYPAGREAAFVITDHCDFDGIDRLQVFAKGANGERGWMGRSLKLTKGVFTIPSVTQRASAPSLQDADYEIVIRHLAADGNEIAPHGVNESGNISSGEFRAALDRIVATYAPRTWFDHGLSLSYCYTMGGADNDHDLLGQLRRHDFLGLWSYFDVPAEPAAGLNLLDFPPPSWTGTVGRTVRHAWAGRAMVAAHYLRTATLLRLGSRAAKAAGFVLSGMRASTMELRSQEGKAAARSLMGALARARRTLAGRRPEPAERQPPLDHIQQLAPTLYPEKAHGLSQSREDDLLLFTTFPVHHLADSYTPRALDHLLSQRGLHVGHCYLLAWFPYLAGLFQRRAPTPKLSREWLEFLDALGDAVTAGRLWNPTAGGLLEWVRRWSQIELIPIGTRSVRLQNQGSEQVRGLTLFLPGAAPPPRLAWDGTAPDGWRAWHDGLAVWGSVPGRGAVDVTWGEPGA